ncbi:MAG: DUF4340 domain-containing protein [Limisphaerales bacterium]
MNRKQLTLLIVVGLVLGGLALMFRNSRDQEFQRRDVGIGEKLLGDFPSEDIVAVTIKSRDGEVNLAKEGVWVVRERSSYPASFSQISELVRKLWDLKPAQSQNVGQSQWGRLELLPPDSKDAGTNTATLVELKAKDGKIVGAVLLGKKQMRDSGSPGGGYPVGRWIALPGKTDTVFVASETFSDIEPKPEAWLNKDAFLKVEKLKSISLVATNPAQSWSLVRTNETSDWAFVEPREGEDLDKGKVSSLNWAFSSPSFTDVQKRDSETLKDPFASPSVIRMGTFEGFTYEITVSSPNESDNYWLTVSASADLPKERVAPADESAEDKEKNEKAWKEQQDKLKEKLKKEQALAGWAFQVAKWTVDSVLKDRSALLAEKKAPDAGAPATEGGFNATPPPLPGAEPDSPPVVVPLDPPPIN